MNTLDPQQDTTSRPPPGVLGGRALVLAYTATALLLVVPLLLTTYPRMVDFPNHLARHYISANLTPDSPLATYYTYQRVLEPNLAVDLAILPFQMVLGTLAAGRAVIALAMLLWLVAPAVLHRAIWGRWSAWPLAAALVVYNSNLSYGFENYYLSAPGALLVYAGWIAARKRLHPLLLALLLTVAAFSVYVGHLIAFALLGLLVGGHALGDLIRSNAPVSRRLVDLLAAGLPFAIGLGHYFSAMVGQDVMPHGRTLTRYGDVMEKASALMSPMYSLGGVFDLGLALAAALLAAAVYPHLRLHRAARAPLLTLVAACLVTPTLFLGVYFIDSRLPPALAAVAIAATQPLPWRGWRVASALTGLLLLVRMGSVTQDWVAHNDVLVDLVGALAKVEPGSRVLPAAQARVDPTLWHGHCYGVLERDIFLPSLFTGGSTLKTTDAYAHLDTPQTVPVLTHRLDQKVRTLFPYWKDWRNEYDYLLVLRNPGVEPERPRPDLQFVSRSTVYTLYRIPKGE